MSDLNDKLLDHDYDGIKELDNDLPRWWVWLFILTIIWSFAYMIYYHVADIGYLSTDEYRLEMNPNYIRIQESDAKLMGVLNEYRSPYFNSKGEMTPRMRLLGQVQEAYIEESRESDTISYFALTEPEQIASGVETYKKNCVSCHGNFGEGGIGPNLTDNYWMHKSSMTDVVKSIKYGYPAKGMISWRGFLKEDQILEVASFVLTLKGTNPPNAKSPQGDLVED